VSTKLGAILLAAVVAGAVVPTTSLIVPGQGVGPIVLGMRIVQVFQYLGPPARRVRTETTERFLWPDRGITVRVDFDGRVEAIFVEHPDYRTAQGVGVGSTLEEVVRAFGPTEQVQEDRTTLVLAYPRLGISFAIGKERGNRVQMVLVYRPVGR